MISRCWRWLVNEWQHNICHSAFGFVVYIGCGTTIFSLHFLYKILIYLLWISISYSHWGGVMVLLHPLLYLILSLQTRQTLEGKVTELHLEVTQCKLMVENKDEEMDKMMDELNAVKKVSWRGILVIPKFIKVILFFKRKLIKSCILARVMSN